MRTQKPKKLSVLKKISGTFRKFSWAFRWLGTVKLFTYRGVPVYLHWSAKLLVLLMGLTIFAMADVKRALIVLMAYVILFSVVLLHELGHVVAAAYYGVRTRNIYLHSLGGTALLKGPYPQAPSGAGDCGGWPCGQCHPWRDSIWASVPDHWLPAK